MGRLGLAFRCFFRVLAGKPVPEAALPPAEEPAALPAPEAPAVDPRALQLLGLLQREGRLLDFLMEEIAPFDDAQVGAAVRQIHADSRRVIEEHVDLAPALDGEEDGPVTVEPGFDPSRVRLVGNVTGEPPFTGVLRHRGWRATALRLPDPPEGADPTIIAPAEVEVG